MSQQSLNHSEHYSTQINEPKYPLEMLQTPMKKQM